MGNSKGSACQLDTCLMSILFLSRYFIKMMGMGIITDTINPVKIDLWCSTHVQPSFTPKIYKDINRTNRVDNVATKTSSGIQTNDWMQGVSLEFEPKDDLLWLVNLVRCVRYLPVFPQQHLTKRTIQLPTVETCVWWRLPVAVTFVARSRHGQLTPSKMFHLHIRSPESRQNCLSWSWGFRIQNGVQFSTWDTARLWLSI